MTDLTGAGLIAGMLGAGMLAFGLMLLLSFVIGVIVLWKVTALLGYKKSIGVAFIVWILAIVFTLIFGWIPFVGWLIGFIFVWVTVKIAYDMRGMSGWGWSFLSLILAYIVTALILIPLYMIMFVMFVSIFVNIWITIAIVLIIIAIFCVVIGFAWNTYKSGGGRSNLSSEGRRIGRGYGRKESYR